MFIFTRIRAGPLLVALPSPHLLHLIAVSGNIISNRCEPLFKMALEISSDSWFEDVTAVNVYMLGQFIGNKAKTTQITEYRL